MRVYDADGERCLRPTRLRADGRAGLEIGRNPDVRRPVTPDATSTPSASSRLTASSVRFKPSSAQIRPASAALKSRCSPFSSAIFCRTGNSFFWNAVVQLDLHVVQFRLRILLKALELAGLLLDFLFELPARLLVHQRAAGLELLLVRLQRPSAVRRSAPASASSATAPSRRPPFRRQTAGRPPAG